jgi:hypothetical protein
MSHWAEIDKTGLVVRVLVGDNNEPDEGQAFVESLGGTWVKTSYNGNIRKNYAGIGMSYDPVNDWFFAPQPYLSWVLDSEAQWQAPVSYPTDDKHYSWNEETLSWVEIE